MIGTRRLESRLAVLLIYCVSSIEFQDAKFVLFVDPIDNCSSFPDAERVLISSVKRFEVTVRGP